MLQIYKELVGVVVESLAIIVLQSTATSNGYRILAKKLEQKKTVKILANVNVHVRYMLSPVRLSVTFVHPTQPVGIFGIFFAVWYLGHPLTSTEKFTEVVPGEPLRLGV